jgi:hypothetical protein
MPEHDIANRQALDLWLAKVDQVLEDAEGSLASTRRPPLGRGEEERSRLPRARAHEGARLAASRTFALSR